MARSRRSRKRAQPRPWHEPSDKEKCQKIDQAITALEAGNAQVIADKHLDQAFKFLGIQPELPENVSTQEKQQAEEDATAQMYDYIIQFLYEIKETGPIACFDGYKAKRCYEPGYQDLFLFPYIIQSQYHENEVYLKFAIKTLRENNHYCFCSLHEPKY